MLKNILFIISILVPLIGHCDAVQAGAAAANDGSNNVPLEKCDATTLKTCEVLPVFVDVPMKETAVVTQPWGRVFMSSTPHDDFRPGTKRIDVVISVQCSGQTKRVIFKDKICGYQKFETKKNLESFIFTVEYNPKLNISADQAKVLLTYKLPGTAADGACGADTSYSAPIGCPLNAN